MSGPSYIALPGQALNVPDDYLRGHGTFVSPVDGELKSSVAGTVERINKLVSVRPFKSRYAGNVGDVVVGRITEVGNKMWKVDVNARQEAILPLGSINLPGGAQRRRTLEDRLQMRHLFAESNVISCEVATVKNFSGITVQTRSLKYGKLENGIMVVVSPALVKRVRKHFVTLRSGVDLVLGHNGYIWITASSGSSSKSATDDESNNDDAMEEEQEDKHTEEAVADVEKSRLVGEMEEMKAAHAKRVITLEERARIARVANSIKLLSDAMIPIMPRAIETVYAASTIHAPNRPSEMLLPQISQQIILTTKERLAQ